MKRNRRCSPRNSPLAFLVLLLTLSIFVRSSQVLAKSHRPITVCLCSFPNFALNFQAHGVILQDAEIRQKKLQCYADIDSGLWGWQCKSSMISRENCALRCLSPACYELIYESDPLEEGEKDLTRSQEFKYCMHK